MKPTAVALLATCAVAAPAPLIPYSQWMTDSMIRNGHELEPDFHYDEATLYTSFEVVYEANGNETVYDFYRSHVYAVVLEDGTIDGYNHSHYSLDNYRFGNNILWWYERTGEARFKIAADKIKNQLDKHPRTPTGGFWHRHVTYPNQMWLDGIYMADTFYAKWTRLFQPENATAWDDIARQFDNIDARTRVPATDLLVHGYDESKRAVWADPVTGAAPLVWGRAVGWYFMALLEVAALLPEGHAGRGRLLGYFTALAGGLKEAQDEASGGWWNVMSEPYPERAGNYIESSASVMFTFGLLKGLRLGILPKEEFTETAAKAYRGMVDSFVTENDDGTLNWEGTVEVGSLGSNATFQYYSSIKTRRNDLRGGGVFMLAALEWENRAC
ncbi:hypothetical protein ACHAQA_000963 [Verticillium albo-atrum]